MKKIIFMLLAVTALTGCSKFEQVPEAENSDIPANVDDGEAPVELHGVINDVGTRGSGPVTGATPSGALTLSVFRVDASAGTTFPAAYTTPGITGSMETDGTITMDPKQTYFADGTRFTKFIAVHPSGGTYNPSNRTITFTSFDGTDDIMSSSLVQGSRTSPAATMTFNHLLTQVFVKVQATSAEAAAIWGQLRGVSITGKRSNVVVTLPATTTTNAATIAATGTATDLPLTQADGSPTANITLDTSVQDFGCAMFVPVTGSTPITLRVTTERGNTLSTTATGPFEANRAYEIVLNFTEGEVSIGGSSSTPLNEWDPVTGIQKDL